MARDHRARYQMRKTLRACEYCGHEFVSRDARFCSFSCRPRDRMYAENPSPTRIAKEEAQQRKETRAAVREAERLAREASLRKCCPTCGLLFRAGRQDQKYCSAGCKARANTRGPVTLECVVCLTTFESRNSTTRYCSRRCKKKAEKKAPAETARRRAAERIRRMRPALIARYGLVCYLCGGTIDPDAKAGRPRSLTIDHVVPIAAGGSDVEANLRPAHRFCNEDKSDRLPTWWERRAAGMRA